MALVGQFEKWPPKKTSWLTSGRTGDSPGSSELLGVGSFVPRYALVSEETIVGPPIHQDAAFSTDNLIQLGRERLRHGYLVFGSAGTFVRSCEPFHEFGHGPEYAPEGAESATIKLTQANPPAIICRRSFEGLFRRNR